MSSFLDSKFLSFPPHSIAVLVKLTTVSMAVTLCTELFTTPSTFVNSPLHYMYNESLTFHKTVDIYCTSHECYLYHSFLYQALYTVIYVPVLKFNTVLFSFYVASCILCDCYI